MNTSGSRKAFVRFTLGVLLVVGGLSAAVAALQRGPAPDLKAPLSGRADDAALDHLRRYLLQAHGLKVVVAEERPAIAWNDGFSLARHGLADYLRSHAFTFAATREAGGAPDVWRARARVSAAGVPIEIIDLVNLTRTDHGEEHGLVVHGPFVAFLNRIDGRLRQVVLLDFRGEGDGASTGQGFADRVMDAVANWQEVKDARGLGRRTFEFLKSPARAALRFDADGARLVVDYGEAGPAVIDCETGALGGAGAGGLASLPRPPKARRMPIDWIANTVRRFIGERRFEWLKVYALALKDRWKRLSNVLFGPSTPDRAELEEGRVVTAHAPVKRRQVEFGQDPNWPPPPVEPILRHPELRGEGQWVDIYDFDLRNPGAPPALLKTIIRPDPQRPHAAVRIVLMDPRQVDLHIMAGTKHPESTTGQQGDGLIPRDPETLGRLLAAFNGGFKTMHGAFGMMVQRKVIVPARRAAATVARLSSGQIAMGTWELPDGARPASIVSYRQNLPPLIAEGVVNPTGLRKWGNTVDDMDGRHTYRSALGVTRHGHLMYVWGDDLSAETMAAAMTQAGCDYAIHLDMNHGHSRFEFYRVYDDESIARRHPERKLYVEGTIRYQAKKLSGAQISWLYPRYIRRDIRDFFYLTLRRVFPYEDPQQPRWSVEGLPAEFREFPPLCVGAKLRVQDEPVEVLKIDAARARWRLRLGREEAGAAPVEAREITRDEVPRLAAVIAAGAPDEGVAPPGTVVRGIVTAPPREGAMTVILDREGRARVERWTPRSAGVWDARQGLALVDNGRIAEEARAVSKSRVKLRGALGIDRRGDLLYAAARTAWPTALAEALVEAGAVRALALGPGPAEGFFRMYTLGDREGEVVATDLAAGSRNTLQAIPLSHRQAFLSLVPVKPIAPVVPMRVVESGARARR